MKDCYIKCSCLAPEHTLYLTYDEGDKDFVYVSYYLESQSFIGRLWTGIKYIFGYKSKYGDFGETVVDKQTAKRCAEFLLEFAKDGENVV